jgi:hypothetical protein
VEGLDWGAQAEPYPRGSGLLYPRVTHLEMPAGTRARATVQLGGQRASWASSAILRHATGTSWGHQVRCLGTETGCHTEAERPTSGPGAPPQRFSPTGGAGRGGGAVWGRARARGAGMLGSRGRAGLIRARWARGGALGSSGRTGLIGTHWAHRGALGSSGRAGFIRARFSGLHMGSLEVAEEHWGSSGLAGTGLARARRRTVRHWVVSKSRCCPHCVRPTGQPQRWRWNFVKQEPAWCLSCAHGAQENLQCTPRA